MRYFVDNNPVVLQVRAGESATESRLNGMLAYVRQEIEAQHASIEWIDADNMLAGRLLDETQATAGKGETVL